MQFTVEALKAKRHDRAGFDCGAEPLNRYLKALPAQHRIKGIATTFVLIHAEQPSRMLGYYSLSAASLIPRYFAALSGLSVFSCSVTIVTPFGRDSLPYRETRAHRTPHYRNEKRKEFMSRWTRSPTGIQALEGICVIE